MFGSMVADGELTIHRRLAEELERNVHSRDWWLHIQFWLEDEDVDPDVSGVGREVEIWLQTMNPDHNAGNPVATQFSGAAILVEVRAIARGRAHRGARTLLINPLPPLAYFTGRT